MNPKEMLRDWLAQHPLRIVSAVVFGVLALGGILRSVDTLRALVDSLLLQGLQIDWSNKTVATKLFLFILLLAIPIIAGIFLLLYYRSVFLQPEEVKLARKTGKILDGMMRAANRISGQLLPEDHKQIKSFETIKNTYMIYKNFDCEVRREYEIKASGGPLNFWEVVSGVEKEADGVEFPGDINFEVEPGDEYQVSYLPTKNQPHKQAALVFFLPRIEPAESVARKIVVTYKWPGMFKRLGTLQKERYEWNIETSAPFKLAEFFFYLEDGTGYNLECEGPAGLISGQSNKVTNEIHPQKKWHGKLYRVQNGPGGKYAVELFLKKP